VPNTGSAVVGVPNFNTSSGRVMVRGSNNIFFNVNNAIITIQGKVGIEDQTFQNFAVYPNPSEGVFNLKFTPESNEKIEVSLFDLRGRLIHKINYENVVTHGIFDKKLDYNYINQGMYFLVVKNGSKIATKKLIRK